MQMTRDLDELKFKGEELENQKERNIEMQQTLLFQEGQLNQLKDQYAEQDQRDSFTSTAIEQMRQELNHYKGGYH